MTGIWCVTEGKTRKIRSEKQGHVRNTRHCSQRGIGSLPLLVKLPVFLEHKHSSVYDKAEGILSP